jgi:manganese transport protein
VSLIGLSFLLELWLAEVEWSAACRAWVRPSLPPGSLPLVTAILGAVVMPHNLFLHSEIIQSREWNLQDKVVIRRQLRFEFLDTLFSMGIGWVVNSAMIITAAATFFRHGVAVTELAQAQELLHHLLGPAAALLFALALLLSGVSSSITAGMAGSSIMAGLFGEPYNIRDVHSRLGAGVTYLVALLAILVIPDPFQGLIYSQIFLCLQLPLTVLLLVTLTSSRKVMGEFANSLPTRVLLAACAAIVTVLNIQLLLSLVG